MFFKENHWAGTTMLSLLALLFAGKESQAQCKSGQQRPQNSARQQSGSQQQFAQQQLLQQMLFQQMLQQTQQLNTLIGLQQQRNGLVGLQQQQQNDLLNAVRQQGQQNSYLIALQKKQRTASENYQTGRAPGLSTVDPQLLNALQTAFEQTQTLLSALEQQGAIANQSAWVSALQRQLSTLTDMAQQGSLFAGP